MRLEFADACLLIGRDLLGGRTCRIEFLAGRRDDARPSEYRWRLGFGVSFDWPEIVSWRISDRSVLWTGRRYTHTIHWSRGWYAWREGAPHHGRFL